MANLSFIGAASSPNYIKPHHKANTNIMRAADESPGLVFSMLAAANLLAAVGGITQWRRQRHQAIRMAFKGHSRSAGYLPIEHCKFALSTRWFCFRAPLM